MRPRNFLEKIWDAFLSSKVWLSVIFIFFGVSVVVYVFMIVTSGSTVLLPRI